MSGDSSSWLAALSLHMVMADFMEKFGGASGFLLSPLQITAQSEEEGVRPELHVQARAKLDSPPPHTPEHTLGAGCPRVWGVWLFPSSVPLTLFPVTSGKAVIRGALTQNPVGPDPSVCENSELNLCSEVLAHDFRDEASTSSGHGSGL